MLKQAWIGSNSGRESGSESGTEDTPYTTIKQHIHNHTQPTNYEAINTQAYTIHTRPSENSYTSIHTHTHTHEHRPTHTQTQVDLSAAADFQLLLTCACSEFRRLFQTVA